MATLPRRRFNHLLACTLGAAVVPGRAHPAAAVADCYQESFAAPGFGPIAPVLPDNTDELSDVPAHGDLRGVPLLRLPAGFRYRAVSIEGQTMSDGLPVPARHDGMAWFRRANGDAVLVRNHEIDLSAGGHPGAGCRVSNPYDDFAGNGFGGGGTTTVVLDQAGHVRRHFVSLGGTLHNCAGGPTPWGSWLSCEEDVSMPGGAVRRRHGYAFEVPSGHDAAVEPVPLTAMGRMNREAVSVDPRRGELLQTEDRGDAAMYRFTPDRPPRAFGDLQRGGVLHALAIRPDQRGCDGTFLPVTRAASANVVDTRGVPRGAPGSMRAFLGQPLEAHWVRLEDVDPDTDSLRTEAHARGAALWWRPEGAWFHGGQHYWVCTGAGDAAEGQVWRYDPVSATVMLLLESTREDLLDGPDNMTVAEDGVLYLCEDGSAGTPGDANYSQYVVGVAKDGGLFPLAHNVIPGSTSEFCGVCLSDDQQTLCVNSQTDGITYVIRRAGGAAMRPAGATSVGALARGSDRCR